MMFTPPKPSGAFRWVQLPPGLALVCEPLDPFARHFFTTRNWRLGKRTEQDGGWGQIADAAQVPRPSINHLRQVHGAQAVVVRKAANDRRTDVETAQEEADILLTDDPTRAIAVKAADCLPILIVDRTTRVVAAAHAGWRGLASRVPSVAVERLETEFGSRRRDLLAAVGPAIGACCYEVGDDVRGRFQSFSPHEVARWFAEQPAAWPGNPSLPALSAKRRDGHSFFDPWQCARDQLTAAGIPTEQIFVAELCTASHPDVLCSYRRDGAEAGRMVGAIRGR
jgi:purine-nucleoside/S-methyl-5'-thioadenosine phosphorylase / adenosine deaminase